MNCFECGRPAAYRHHVIPKSKGGKKTVPLCGVCHALIHGRLSLHTAELTRAALRSRRSSGMKTGGDIPFGYRVEAGRLVPDADEQKAVRLVLDLSRTGRSLRDIGRHLEDAGVARKNGSRTWHPQAVLRIIERDKKAA
jgi:hypothetical protein